MNPGNLREMIGTLHIVTPRLPFRVGFVRVARPRRIVRLGNCHVATFGIGRGMLYCNCALRVLHRKGFSTRETGRRSVPLGC